ncbi:hypothetical protein [Paenibacillus sp. EPM92]|uniref:hypothetical protein n=1 Tax=Paenibacillus sp. EPM92 TaxID=1561195 RepID=UPI0019163777|nr:hypothetical protein [Paenibacillus sp. EPM92]
MELFNKPMGVGTILDRSFQLYRKHFTMTYLLALLFFGPFYFVQNVLLYDMSGVSFLPQSEHSISGSFDLFLNGNRSGQAEMSGGLAGLALLMPLYILAFFPSSVAAQLHLVNAAGKGESIRFGDLFRQSFTPYWRMVGNTFLFGLIVTGIYIGLIIVFVAVFGVLAIVGTGFGAAFTRMGADPLGGGIAFVALIVILYLLALFAVLAVVSYFVVRFGFYLPVVAVEKEGQALRRSWRLTRGSFWRIFAIYLVLTVIYTVFLLGIYALLVAVFKMSLLGQLIYVLLSLLITPFYMIPYAVIYFDLRLRSEGADLEQMLARSLPNVNGHKDPDAAMPGNAVDDRPEDEGPTDWSAVETKMTETKKTDE